MASIKDAILTHSQSVPIPHKDLTRSITISVTVLRATRFFKASKSVALAHVASCPILRNVSIPHQTRLRSEGVVDIFPHRCRG